jgi:hypothetical protein
VFDIGGDSTLGGGPIWGCTDLIRPIMPFEISSFSSSMGPAIVSAEWAARVSTCWIRKSAWYVPVTLHGIGVSPCTG